MLTGFSASCDRLFDLELQLDADSLPAAAAAIGCSLIPQPALESMIVLAFIDEARSDPRKGAHELLLGRPRLVTVAKTAAREIDGLDLLKIKDAWRVFIREN